MAEVAPAPGRGRRALRRLRRHPAGLVAALVLALFVTAALLAPALAPYDPLAHDLTVRLRAPHAAHPMGTDAFGRDVLSRVLYGARASLGTALAGVALATLLGTLLGTLSGYAGGRIDLVAQRVVDALLAFPALVLALLLVAALRPSPTLVVAAVTLALAPQIARFARARCLEVASLEHVLAARALGAGNTRIVLRHVLPHVTPATIVLATGYVGTALVLEAALSYLGLGLPPPTPAWGRMIQEGAHLYLETAPWLTVFPGLALGVVTLAATVLGDALRDAADPRAQHGG